MTKDTDLHQTLGIATEKGKWKRRAYWIVPVILLVGSSSDIGRPS